MAQRVAKEDRPPDFDVAFRHPLDGSSYTRFVDLDEVGSEQTERGVGVQRRDLLRYPVRGSDVVSIETGNNVSRGMTDSELERGHQALIDWACDNADARIPPRLMCKDVVLAGPIINNDQLEVAVALIENASDRGIEKPQIAVHGQDDGYAWGQKKGPRSLS
jgi:hypothetical protein